MMPRYTGLLRFYYHYYASNIDDDAAATGTCRRWRHYEALRLRYLLLCYHLLRLFTLRRSHAACHITPLLAIAIRCCDTFFIITYIIFYDIDTMPLRHADILLYIMAITLRRYAEFAITMSLRVLPHAIIAAAAIDGRHITPLLI